METVIKYPQDLLVSLWNYFYGIAEQNQITPNLT